MYPPVEASPVVHLGNKRHSIHGTKSCPDAWDRSDRPAGGTGQDRLASLLAASVVPVPGALETDNSSNADNDMRHLRGVGHDLRSARRLCTCPTLVNAPAYPGLLKRLGRYVHYSHPCQLLSLLHQHFLQEDVVLRNFCGGQRLVILGRKRTDRVVRFADPCFIHD